MKFLVLAVIVFAVLWLARSGRQRDVDRPVGGNRSKPLAQQEEMVACAQCGVHLPLSEALPGRGGVFCGEPHRLAFEKAHADT